MKKALALAVIVILVLAGLLVRQSGKSAPKTETPPAAKTDESESRVTHGTNGETTIRIDAATRTTMGLQTTNLEPANLGPEITVFGRVLDPVPLSAAISDLLSARATAGVSQKELARLKILAGQNNTSARAVETAAGTAQRDDAIAEAAQARISALVGLKISRDPGLVGMIKSMVSGESALVLLNLPVGTDLPEPPATAALTSLSHDAGSVEAQFAGTPPSMDVQTQTRGLLYLVATNASHLAAGEAVTGFLKGPGEELKGWIVPRSAVVRFNGTTWIYAQAGDDEFERVEASLVRPLAAGWFARPELKPDAKVVTVGAQDLLSEELKGQLAGD